RRRLKVGRVGVIYQTILTRFQDVTPRERERLIDFIWKLKDRTDVTIISNYIDEVAESSTIFGSRSVRYSYRSEDYLEFFDEVDCIIGARLHGCLGAMSRGIPAVLLGSESDQRSNGAAEQIPVLLTGNLSD